jgi:hypothetical protein
MMMFLFQESKKMKCPKCNSNKILKQGQPYILNHKSIQCYQCQSCETLFMADIITIKGKQGKKEVISHKLKFYPKSSAIVDFSIFILFIGVIFGFQYIGNKLSSPDINKLTEVPNSPKSIQKSNNYPSAELPANATISKNWKASKKELLAPFKIITRGNRNYFIKLLEEKTSKQMLTIFIRAGESASVDIPLGRYKIRYATGFDWHGEQYLFGVDGLYKEISQISDFRIEKNKAIGEVLEFDADVNSNLVSKLISNKDF